MKAAETGTDKLICFTGDIIESPDTERGCRTKMRVRVDGDLARLWQDWSHGLHRVTYYGDLAPDHKRFCRFNVLAPYLGAKARGVAPNAEASEGPRRVAPEGLRNCHRAGRLLKPRSAQANPCRDRVRGRGRGRGPDCGRASAPPPDRGRQTGRCFHHWDQP
jgi:hypothetical protein